MSQTFKNAARRFRDEDAGMTLIELIIGMVIGLAVSFAAFLAIESANRMQSRTQFRIEAVDRGRLAMDAIGRSVRSQQCFNNTRPMLWASSTGMEFYASVAPAPSTAGQKQPIERHRIVWTAAADKDDIVNDGAAVGDIVETVWRSTINPTTGAVTWPAQSSPTVVRTIATDVEQAVDKNNSAVLAPMFKYFKYVSTTGSGRTDENSPVPMTNSSITTSNPLGLPSASPTDLAGIVLIQVSYRATPRKSKVSKSASVNFYNTISVRIADPTNPAGSPQCL